ncbi:MAG TPA: hypothetical protein VEA41_03845 [Salinarimonas sp.]|nr:hypothetical protein [Salinarimonas sp.]
MAMATIPLIPNDGVLLINDGAGSPLSYAIVYEDGDFTLGGLKKSQKEVQEFLDRGRFYSVRETNDVSIDWSFSCHAIAMLGDGVTASPTDVFLKLGVWSAATNLLPAAAGGGASGVWCVKMTFTGERTDYGATADTTAVLKYCHAESLDFGEGIPGKWSLKGKLYCHSTDYLTLTG